MSDDDGRPRVKQLWLGVIQANDDQTARLVSAALRDLWSKTTAPDLAKV